MKPISQQDWFGAIVAVLLLSLLLSIASPYFLTTGNLSNILVQASVIALLAGGQTFVILTGGVDLAVGALTALCGAVAGHMMIKLGMPVGWPCWRRWPLAQPWVCSTVTWWRLLAFLRSS